MDAGNETQYRNIYTKVESQYFNGSTLEEYIMRRDINEIILYTL